MCNNAENYKDVEDLYINKFKSLNTNQDPLSCDESKQEIYMECIVESMDSYIDENVVIIDPFRANESTRAAFIVKDGVILQLIEKTEFLL